MKKHLFHALLISILAFFVYLNSFSGSLHYDDFFAITGNSAVRDLGNMSEIFRLFPGRFILMYSFAVNYFFHGSDAVGYHIANFIFHVSNALLLYFFALILFRKPRSTGEQKGASAIVPLLVALLFTAHPLMTESVTYIAGRASSLAAVFFLGSLLLYAKGFEQEIASCFPSRKSIFYAMSLLVFFLSLWVKESNATLPAIILVYDFLFNQDGQSKQLKNSILRSLPYFVILAVILLWRKMYIGVIGDPYQIRSFSTNLSTQLRVAVIYLRLLFLPFGQNIDHYVRLSKSPLEPSVLLSLLFLLTLLVSSTALIRRNKGAAFGILWFFITLSPTSLVPLWDVMSERWLYLPAVGVIIAVASLLQPLQKTLDRSTRFHNKKLIPIISASVLVLLGTVTISRNRVWTSEYTLWKDATEKSPAKVRPHTNLGIALAEMGKFPEAISELNTALSLDPGSPEVSFSLGSLYLRLRKYDDAIATLAAVLNRFPDHAKIPVRLADDFARAHFNLGVAYFYRGFSSRALEEYRQALQLAPYLPWLHSNIGALYEAQGKYELALAEYQKELDLYPNVPQVLSNIENIKRKLRARNAEELSSNLP